MIYPYFLVSVVRAYQFERGVWVYKYGKFILFDTLPNYKMPEKQDVLRIFLLSNFYKMRLLNDKHDYEYIKIYR